MAMIDYDALHAAALDRQTAERKEAEDAKTVAWVFFWSLFVFKIVSGAVLLFWVGPGDVLLLVGATSWFWLVIPGVALAGPIGYRVRLRRMRKRRDALRRSEFVIDDAPRRGTSGK